jgi:predicted nucleic acid-binding protein
MIAPLSPLPTLGEVLANPFEAGRDDIVAIYEEMLTPSAWLSVLPVERAIPIQAARLQSQLALRLPDAIHVATAAVAGCSAVLSNDRRLRVPADIKLHRLR